MDRHTHLVYGFRLQGRAIGKLDLFYPVCVIAVVVSHDHLVSQASVGDGQIIGVRAHERNVSRRDPCAKLDHIDGGAVGRCRFIYRVLSIAQVEEVGVRSVGPA